MNKKGAEAAAVTLGRTITNPTEKDDKVFINAYTDLVNYYSEKISGAIQPCTAVTAPIIAGVLQNYINTMKKVFGFDEKVIDGMTVKDYTVISTINKFNIKED